jgi:rubrerythrin
MKFFEAAEIAKKNPGSHFSRSESGLFVVHMNDGRVITSPGQLTTPLATTDPSRQITNDSTEIRIESLEISVTSLNRQLEASNTEIRQLRTEVNNLKEAIAKIPASEWSRYEEEQRKLDEQRKTDERERIIGLARSGQLSHDQLTLVADNATNLGISGEDLKFVQDEVFRTRKYSISSVHMSCRQCGGDGGAGGRCPRCGGNGFES